MKKAISLLLAFVLLLGILPVSALAANDPQIVLTVDKTHVEAGSDVTVTITLDKDIAAMGFGECFVYFDSAIFARKSYTDGTAIPGTAVSKKSLDAKNTEIPTMQKISISTANLTDVDATAGEVATITFTAKEDITALTETELYVLVDFYCNNSWKYYTVGNNAPVKVTVGPSTVAVTGIALDKTALTLNVGETGTLTPTVLPEDATDKSVSWSSSDEAVATVSNGVVTAVATGNATITAKAGEYTATCAVTVSKPAPAVNGYTVTMGEDKSVVVGENVTVGATVGHAADVSVYNAFDMTFTYDASILELTSKEIEGMTVTAGNGTVRVQCYGTDRSVGTAPFSLTFKAVSAGNATVTVTSAKVDIAANAVEFDAPEAELLDAATAVAVSGYAVTLPDNFQGAPVAMPGENYTFSAPTDYYDYQVTATVDGKEIEVTDNGAGTYTIPADKVTGNIVISMTREGKKFAVTLGTDMTGPEQAQYMTNYTATLAAAEGYTYEVAVTIGGQTYTGYSVAEGVYTIPGADITGEIVFTVTKTELPPSEYKVTFTGSGAGDVKNSAATAKPGKNYMFRVIKAEGYVYTVTATVNGKAVQVIDAGATGMQPPGVYAIAAADITGDIVITVTKTADLSVAVSKYVELDGKTVFLVTASGTLAEGKAYAYDGNAMFYSDVYKTWCYLVIAEDEFNADAAKAKVAATETSYITLTATTDVNMSNVVDINDAQLTYDIYNGKYEDFSVVVMQKFLNADVNGDKVVNVSDAAAVVAAIQ